MKLNQICGTLLATALTMSAAAQVSLYIRTGPPPYVTKSPAQLPHRAMPGSMATGRRTVLTTDGSQDAGTILRMRGLRGTTPTTATTGKAGSYTRGTGTTRITAMTTGTSVNATMTAITIATIKMRRETRCRVNL
jgi:hypothetical protein